MLRRLAAEAGEESVGPSLDAAAYTVNSVSQRSCRLQKLVAQSAPLKLAGMPIRPAPVPPDPRRRPLPEPANL